MGDLYSTYNGGSTWAHKTIGNTLYGITFFNKDTGFVISSGDNRLLKTTDGGKTWNQDTFLLNNAFYPLASFYNGANNYYVFGNNGFYYYTTDAGNSWKKVDVINDGSLLSISFLKNNPDKGWVATRNSSTEGKLYYTEDGGKTWTERFNNDFIWKVMFVNDSTGWVNGLDFIPTTGTVTADYYFYKTTDAGKTWNAALKPYPGAVDYSFFSETEGLAYFGEVGGIGYIAYTNDGGQSWLKLTPFIELGVDAVAFKGKEQCWFTTGQHQLCKWGKMPSSFSLQSPADFSTPELFTESVLTFEWDKVDFVRDYTLELTYKGKTVSKSFPGNYNLYDSAFFKTTLSYNQTRLLLDSLRYDGTEDILWQVFAGNIVEPSVKSSAQFHIRPNVVPPAPSPLDANKVTLFPNPATDIVTINVNGNATLTKPFKICDALGQQFNIAPIGYCNCNQAQLDISTLASGVYFITVETDNGKQTAKLVKP